MDEFLGIITKSIVSKDVPLPLTLGMELKNDLGLSSLDMMVILCELERSYQIEIPISKLAEVITLNDLYLLATHCSLAQAPEE